MRHPTNVPASPILYQSRLNERLQYSTTPQRLKLAGCSLRRMQPGAEHLEVDVTAAGDCHDPPPMRRREPFQCGGNSYGARGLHNLLGTCEDELDRTHDRALFDCHDLVDLFAYDGEWQAAERRHTQTIRDRLRYRDAHDFAVAEGLPRVVSRC